MTAKTLAELALKVWGVMLILEALSSLPTTLWALATFPAAGDEQAALMHTSQAGILISIAVRGVIGLAVLVWADALVRLFEDSEVPLEVTASPREVGALAFAVVGVFVLVSGLQSAAFPGYVWFTTRGLDLTGSSQYFWERQGETLARAAVQVAAGTFLLVGSEAVLRGWRKVRGFPPSDPPADHDAA